jgi:tetratricopeptide (TPR) repeat protein
LLLAEAYLVQKNIDQSLRVYRQAMELFPRDPQVPFLIGMVLEEQSKRAEARKAFEKSPEVSPDYLPALEQLVELDVSEAQYATAMDRVKKGVEKNPTMAQLWVLQARIHLAQRDTSQAEADLSRAINLNPDLQTAYLLLAQLYVASDRPSQAMERLAALAARTNDLTALMQIGRMQEELKNSHAARNAYEKLLVANPDFSPASDQVRLCTRRFISRHFQQPIYDYRSVWTSFTGGIASRVNELKLSQAAVKLVADIFQVLSVSIWLVDDHGGNLTFAASSSLLETTGEAVRPQNADAIELIRALRHHPDPVDIDASKENWAAEPSSP